MVNIASGTPEQTRLVVECGAVPHFVTLLSHSKVDVRSYCTPPRHYDDPHAVASDGGATQAPCTHVVYGYAQVVDNAVWALANIIGDSSQLRDAVLECGALPKLVQVRR